MKVLVEMGRGVRDVAAWALHRLADRVGSQAIHSLGDRVSGLTLRKLLLWAPVWFLIWIRYRSQESGETWLDVLLDVALFALFVAGCFEWCRKAKHWWGKWRQRVRAKAQEHEAEQREILDAHEPGRKI